MKTRQRTHRNKTFSSLLQNYLVSVNKLFFLSVIPEVLNRESIVFNPEGFLDWIPRSSLPALGGARGDRGRGRTDTGCIRRYYLTRFLIHFYAVSVVRNSQEIS